MTPYMIIFFILRGVLRVLCHVGHMFLLIQLYVSLSVYLYTRKIEGHIYLLNSS